MNDQPALSPDFDLDAWIDGSRGITALARIVQRGDLIAKRTRLEDELRVARKVKPEERGLQDQTPETIQAKLDQIDQDLYDSMLVVTIEDRTTERRVKVREQAAEAEGLKADGDKLRYNTVTFLAELADAIIKVETADGRQIPLGPEGFGWKRLEKIRDKCGEASLVELVDRYRDMTSNAPAVRAPFSPSSSPAPNGTTSPRSFGPRANGVFRRG